MSGEATLGGRSGAPFGGGRLENRALYPPFLHTRAREGRRGRPVVAARALSVRGRWARVRRALSARERGRLRRALSPRGGRVGLPRAALAGERGQSAIELVALLPLLAGLALGLLALLAAGRAHEDAAQAAEAGAVALLHDGDPRVAACAALGRSGRCRAGVRIRGSRVTVSVRPSGPIRRLNRQLQATETADAGPEGAP